MLVSAYSTSDSQSSSPSPFATTTTTTTNGVPAILNLSIDRALIGMPSNTNATSHPSPKHEHDFEGSAHDGEEGAGQDEEEVRVVRTITIIPVKVSGKGNAHKCTVASGMIKKSLAVASASSRLDRRWCWRAEGGRRRG